MAKGAEISGLSHDDTFREAAARIVEVRARELFEHSEGVLDRSDIERVHDMRVASRRLRAVLEIFEPCFPRKRHAEVLRDVKRIADALGARRDPDVHIAALRRIESSLPEPDRAGLESLIAVFGVEQGEGNTILATELERIAAEDLKGRIATLVAAARGERSP